MATITKIPGFKIGNAQNYEAATGCTVILCEQGATAGVDVRGGAPGTRETDLLRPENVVDKIHAVLLAGGSAFGLDAATGVMQYLEERGSGYDVGVARVPIVCGAVLFDLTCGSSAIRPDRDMGYAACRAADTGSFAEGTAGAGTGATVGKFFGHKHAMKGGLGACCLQVDNLFVGAIAAVNCLGDVFDPQKGRIIAGAYQDDPFAFLDCETGMAESNSSGSRLFAGNTTIGAILTNADLTKAQANKIAAVAQNGYARTIKPVHTLFDGDTIFCLSSGGIKAEVNTIGVLAVRAMEQAVVSAVTKASPLAGFRSCQSGMEKTLF